MTRVHQVTFAHAKHLLASLERIPRVVGATVFEAGVALTWMEMGMVRSGKGGGQGEEEEEEEEGRS